MKIFKFRLDIINIQTIYTPANTEFLDVQVQYDTPCIWGMCDEKASNEARHIAIYSTGETLPKNPGEYIGTFQHFGASLIFHVFEVDRATMKELKSE